jgi:hypothetical protein
MGRVQDLRALGSFLGRIDFQSTAAHAGAGERRRRFVSFRRIRHFDEGETAWTSRLLIGHDAHTFDYSMSLKQSSQFVLSRSKREIANVKVLHKVSLLVMQIGQ